MNKIIFLAAALCLASCSRRTHDGAVESGSVLRIAYSVGSSSRSSGLQADQAAGVFLLLDGRGDYSLLNHRFVSSAAGVLSGDPAAYYPDAQAVRMYAYVPYQADQNDPRQVAYSLPTDQTSDASFRSADLLRGEAFTAPSESAVPMLFTHVFAKLSVEVRDELGAEHTVSALSAAKVRTEGALDASTGVFSLSPTQTTVQAAGRSSLVLPPQALESVSIEATGVWYGFVPPSPLVLEQGKEYTLRLLLNRASESNEAVLQEVVVNDWTATAESGSAQHAVSNAFTVHWLLPHPDFSKTARVVLHVQDGRSGKKVELTSTSYTPDGSSTAQAGQAAFTVVGADGLLYPYRIESVDFLRADGSVIQSCGTLLAQGVYRAGAVSLGVFQDHILLVTTDPIVRWDEQTIPGGFDDYKYSGNTFVVKAVEPQFDWKKVAKVRFKIWNGIAEWRGASMVRVSSEQSFQVATGVFTFPDANGFIPGPRHYPIEWVELADASGGYLYRGYTNFEVAETGQIVLWLYPDGTVETPNSSIARPVGQTIEGSVDNLKFSNNTLRLRFFNCYFDTKAARTAHLTIGSTEYVWDFAAAPGANDLLFWGAITFPDKYGSKPNNAYYHISTVELRDASGGYLYKNYCAFDVLRAGTVTIDMHQRGSVDMPSAITPPSSGNGDDLNPPSGVTYVSNTLSVRFYEPPFDRLAANKVSLTLSDGKTYTWNTGIGWAGSSTNPSYGSANVSFPAPTGGRPASYPFSVTAVEVFNGTTSLYKRTGLNTTISYQGSVVVVVNK